MGEKTDDEWTTTHKQTRRDRLQSSLELQFDNSSNHGKGLYDHPSRVTMDQGTSHAHHARTHAR